jgi:hypothetical protein
MATAAFSPNFSDVSPFFSPRFHEQQDGGSIVTRWYRGHRYILPVRAVYREGSEGGCLRFDVGTKGLP